MVRWIVVIIIVIIVLAMIYHFVYYKPIMNILASTGAIIGMYDSFFYNKLDYKTLDEIIENAFNYFPEEEVLSIRTNKEGFWGEIQIEKTDTGKLLLESYNDFIKETIDFLKKNQKYIDSSQIIFEEYNKVIDIQNKVRVAMWKQQNT